MKNVSIDQLIRIIHGCLISGRNEAFLNGVSIDSRTIQPAQAFFAIAGENFDGHDYAVSAIEKGASCVVIERDEVDLPAECHIAVIKVDNCITALAQFAAWYRQQLSTKVIAITGSVGKTTTRGILYQILSRFFKCRQARGSFNNHIGLPLTILSAEPDDEILLLELGSNHLGEIEQLSFIAKPDIAVVTLVAPSHLAGFGTFDNIIKEKASIASHLHKDGKLYINGDQPPLVDYVKEHYGGMAITFGLSDDCDVRATSLESIGDQGSLVIDGRTIHVPLAGRANLFNVLSVWAVCREFDISVAAFAEAAQSLKPADSRLEIEIIGSLTVLNDCYNANPVSMVNGLSCLSSMVSDMEKRKVFIAGSMAELGDQSAYFHQQLGEYVAVEGVQLLLAAGLFSDQVVQGAKNASKLPFECQSFENTEQLCDNLHKWIKPDDIILVKGSRSANLEKAVQRLRELFGN